MTAAIWQGHTTLTQVSYVVLRQDLLCYVVYHRLHSHTSIQHFYYIFIFNNTLTFLLLESMETYLLYSLFYTLLHSFILYFIDLSDYIPSD